MITLSNVEKNYGLEAVLKDFSMTINSGEKVGLIGPNGSGKTTVFKLISGIEKPSKGAVAVRSSLRIGYLKQIPARSEGETVEQRLWQGAKTLKKIEKRLRELEDLMAELIHNDLIKMENYMKEYTRLTQDFENNRGYTYETKMKQIVHGLGLKVSLTDFIINLSGGEMARLELAVLLLSEPDILLLDEPTNHLDFSAISWLEEYLNQFEGTVIIISHDRYFLDKTVKRIVEINNGKEEEYPGSYSYYLEERKKRFELNLRKYLKQEKEIKRKEEAIKRLRHWGHIGNNEKMFKQAFNIEKQIERMEKIDHPSLNETQFQLQFAGNRSGKEVFVCKNVKKGYGDNEILFDKLNLKVFYGERIGLIGPNGSGKTTLLKMITENLKTDEGEVKIGSNVQIGYFDQHQELLDVELTLLDSLRWDIKQSESRVRSILAKFGFVGKQVFKQVKELSGGERSRFILLKMVYSQVNFLILDEPTNHLDLLSIEILEEALKEFTGTLLVVSHDRYFLN
ncbi:MAG: ATP-binding cassette domain-containing protein, partial [Clostridia bacterium]|nr:ATP-binding cassette domain-containing protein [Clostridia bacterium]